jgi:pre-mRNA-splicing factor CWC26
MPDPSLQAYLASKYMSGPKADAILARAGGGAGGDDGKKKKKRKRKDADGTAGPSSSGLRLVDDDEASGFKREDDEDEEGGGGAVIVDAPEESKFKRSKWSSVGGSSSAPGSSTAGEASGSGTTAADAENELEGALVVTSEDHGGSALPTASAPAKAPKRGLMSYDEMRALNAEQEHASSEAKAKAKAAEAERADGAEEELHHQTIYRDARGRKIDVKAEEEARRAREAEERRKEEERKTWGMGVKQKEDKVLARQRLKEEAGTSFAR